MSKTAFLDDPARKGWNVAKGYAEELILKPLIECSDYQKIAMFGTSEMIGEFMTSEPIKTQARIKAVERFRDNLLMIIENARFNILEKDRKIIENLEKELQKLKKYIPLISEIITKRERREIKINDKNFFSVLEILRRIKSELMSPLNNAHMIFPKGDDEYDDDELKEYISKNLIEEG